MSWKNKLIVEDYIINVSGLDDAALESHLHVVEFAAILHGQSDRRSRRKETFASLESS